MTIHRSKGLEWPVVVVADLARPPRASESDMLVDPDLGVAIKYTADDEAPCLFRLLAHTRRVRESLEEKRLLYVASTRARDYLFLSSTAPRGSNYSLRHLEPGLEAAGIERQPWIYEPAHGLPPDPPQPVRAAHTPRVYLGQVAMAPEALPVTGLSAYRTCPRRFRYSMIDGHPGVAMGTSISTRVGTLVHLAIEHAFTQEFELQSFDRGLNAAEVRRALHMADVWRTSPQYARYAKAPSALHEQPMTTEIGGVTLSGRIDLLGPDFVVDFKTGDDILEQSHLLQLWVYGQATGVEELAIAYLRRGELVVKRRGELAGMEAEVNRILEGITLMRFDPTPSIEACSHCPYRTLCSHALVKD
jgi:ATP-dependent helicase/nuclease subunit A